ncbi:MAG: hypothetical protein GX567_12200, partial [Clostridia bacterium]|nr:hypothetical protein [Clostridia bacterium]
MEFLLALFIIVYLMRHHVQASEAGEVYIGITNEKGESLFCENGGTICYNRMIFFHQIRESPVPIEYYVMEEECAPKEHEPIEWELLTSQGVILPLQTDEETIAVRSYHIMFRFQTLEKLLESEDIERGFLENNLVENKEKSFQPIVYECRVIIDQKEPEIKLDSTAELLVWQKDMITCKAVVSECESALKSFDCYINGNVIKQIKWEQTDDQKSQVFEFELTEETTKAGGSILIEACDLAGNKSVYQGTYYLDQTAPVLLVDMPEDKVYAEAVTLVCTNEEMNYEGSSLLVKRVRNELIETPLSMQAETEVIDFSSEHNTTELHFDQEGSYLIELQATDPAGNESESKVCEFSIDLTKPQITINGITEDCFVNREVDFEVVISDLHTQVEIACYIEEGLKQGVCMNDSWYLEQGEGKRAYHLSDDGIYMIRVKAVDQAGNQTVAEIHMGIDQSAPVTAIAGVENELVTNRAQSVICYVEEQFYQSGIVRMRSEHKGFHESELTLSEYPFITSGTLSSSEVHFAEEGR